MKTVTKCVIILFVLTTILSAADDNNWPRWRGPRDNGTAAPGDYPVKWTPEKALWKTEVPGKGFSTPVVWNKQIFMTSGVKGLDSVLAFNWSGKLIWMKTLGAEVEGRHRNASGSNPSPVTDGSAIFVFFKSGRFAALELDGKTRWSTNLFKKYGRDNRFWDFGISPVLTKNHIVMTQMHDGDSWIAAFNKKTGKLNWKVPRNYKTPVEGRQAYTTPIVFSHKGKESLLVWGGQHLTAHDTSDGKLLWSCGDFNPKAQKLWPAVASPVICGETVVVPCGRADRRSPRLHGIKLGGEGDITETHRVWKRKDTGPFVPSPAEYQGRVYITRDLGEIECVDPATGKILWSDAFPKGRGKFYSSPLIAGGHLYATREDGTIFVVRIKDRFELISEIKMNDHMISSPIAVSGRLLIRTEKYLFCVKQSDK